MSLAQNVWRGLTLAGALMMLAAPLRAGNSDRQPLVPLRKAEKISRIPVGDLAGGAESNLAATIDNPEGGKERAVHDGRKLFVELNCADCHGFKAKGNMGPNLTDAAWRFGGTPAQIYASIYHGQPHGMPAWGKTLPPRDIWQLVAYIQSLGGSCAPKNYQACMQGDQSGENVAPELGFEQNINGAPPYHPPEKGRGETASR